MLDVFICFTEIVGFKFFLYKYIFPLLKILLSQMFYQNEAFIGTIPH